MNSAPSGLTCHNLAISVPDRHLVESLDLELAAGEILAILGPNGVGKSLTLHTRAGLRDADAGLVELDGRSLASLPRTEVATSLALLPQYVDDVFPATVLDTVLIGRHPHIPRFQWESDEDRAIALDALRRLDLETLATREIGTLSGGERRRLAIAQILTQGPRIYLLDEPTNHLDPQHQLDVMRLLRELAEAGAAIATSLHDINLAARFADRCLLLFGDGRWELGDPASILTEERLEALYHTGMERVPWRDSAVYVATGRPA